MAENTSTRKIKIGGEIELEAAKAEIKFKTLEDDVRYKSESMNVTITISGELRKADPKPFIQLFKWSKDFDDSTVYRKVEITDTKGTNVTYRTYIFPEMFPISYTEDLVGDHSKYELGLRQKEGFFDQIETF